MLLRVDPYWDLAVELLRRNCAEGLGRCSKGWEMGKEVLSKAEETDQSRATCQAKARERDTLE